MSPTILRKGAYRFYFNSSEEPRMHVHILAGHGKAKFWLEPTISLFDSRGFKPHELKEIESIVTEHAEEFKNAWRKHFPQ